MPYYGYLRNIREMFSSRILTPTEHSRNEWKKTSKDLFLYTCRRSLEQFFLLNLYVYLGSYIFFRWALQLLSLWLQNSLHLLNLVVSYVASRPRSFSSDSNLCERLKHTRLTINRLLHFRIFRYAKKWIQIDIVFHLSGIRNGIVEQDENLSTLAWILEGISRIVSLITRLEALQGLIVKNTKKKYNNNNNNNNNSLFFIPLVRIFPWARRINCAPGCKAFSQ